MSSSIVGGVRMSCIFLTTSFVDSFLAFSRIYLPHKSFIKTGFSTIIPAEVGNVTDRIVGCGPTDRGSIPRGDVSFS